MRLFYLIFLPVLCLIGCTGTPAAIRPTQSPAAGNALAATAAATPTMTYTAVRTSAPATTPAGMLTAVSTSPAPATPTAVPTITPPPVSSPPPPVSSPPPAPLGPDRACPDPAPARPDYQHNVLATQPWPTPDTAVPQPHFWLADPILGGRQPLPNGYYPYGWDGDGRFLLHNGADMPQTIGTPVRAVADGVVVVAQADSKALYGWRCDWYGQLVVLELEQMWQGQPVYVLYGHIRNIMVTSGQRLKQGQPLAEIGVEGVATVPHLHLEVRLGMNTFDSTRNPMLWLAPVPETGVLAGRLVNERGRPWQGVRVTLIDSAGEEPQYQHTFTYLDDPQHLINADEGLAENFVFADLPPGNYTLFATLQGVDYRLPVAVWAGELTAVEIVAGGQ